MRKIRNILVGAAIAGALGLGLGAAPAQAAAAPAAAPAAQAVSAASFDKDFKYWSKNHQAYYKGSWYKKGGKYYSGGKLYHEKFNKGHWGYVWFKYYDKSGKKHTDYYKYYKTSGSYLVKSFEFKKDLDVKVCEGKSRFDSCSKWHDVF